VGESSATARQLAPEWGEVWTTEPPDQPFAPDSKPGLATRLSARAGEVARAREADRGARSQRGLDMNGG